MRTDKLDEAQMQRMMGNEFGGMNDVLANLYAATGKGEYLALAQRFDHKMIFDPLHKGKMPFAACMQIPRFPNIGAAREYELTGQKRYAEIASFFWDRDYRRQNLFYWRHQQF